MATLKQSTAYTRMFMLVQSADHLSALTGATPTVNISKAGGAFAAAGGTVTEVANGWYKVALTTTDTNTLGDLAYHITATSADATDFVDQVTANILGDTLPASLAAGGITSSTFAAGAITNSVLASGAISSGTFAAGAITNSVFATGAISSTTFAAGAINAAAVATGAITNLTFAAGAINAAAIATGAITNSTLAAGTISSGTFAAGAINAASVASDTGPKIADAFLDRDMSLGTDSGTDGAVRTVRQALRFLRNKWSISGGTLTVTKEDDLTASWTAAVTTTAGANPVTANNPTGGSA